MGVGLHKLRHAREAQERQEILAKQGVCVAPDVSGEIPVAPAVVHGTVPLAQHQALIAENQQLRMRNAELEQLLEDVTSPRKAT